MLILLILVGLLAALVFAGFTLPADAPAWLLRIVVLLTVAVAAAALLYVMRVAMAGGLMDLPGGGLAL